MIIDRAFYREAATTTLGVAVVLLVVIVLMSMTFLLGRAARGEQSETVVYILLGLQTLAKLDVLLPLAFYLGILLTLSRWYRDSEMTVLAACGIGLMHFMRPVAVLGLVFGIVVSVGAFYTTPLALRQIENVKIQSAHRSDESLISPGLFTESSGKAKVFYAERILDNGDVQGVFVSSVERGKMGVITAKMGHPHTDPKTGDKFLALRDGTLYDGEPGEPGYRILEFEVYHLRIEPKDIKEAPVSISGSPTITLLRRIADRDANAELNWRLGKALALFVLMLYAVALAYTDARRGRLSNLFVAIVVYFVYSNLLSIGDTMLQHGSIPAVAGLWWVHGGMMLMAAYLLWQRNHNRSLVSLPARLGRG